MISLKATQKQKFQVQFVDAKGNAAQVQQGTLLIDVADATVAALVRDPDDETKFELMGGTPGVTQINVAADADLGEGVVPVNGFVGVEVRPGDAVGVGIVATGDAEEQ